MAENLLALFNDTDTHVQEAFQTPNRHDHKRSTTHCVIIKMPKLVNKERILKAAGEKCQLLYTGKHIRITSDLSAQTLKARKAWSDKLQAWREKNCQSRIHIFTKAILDTSW
jgi:hypothetical protein